MIDYNSLALDWNPEERTNLDNWAKLLWPLWLKAYREMTPWPANPWEMKFGNFEYVLDDFDETLTKHRIPADTIGQGRVIVAHGLSTPHGKHRDDYRLRGWPVAKFEDESWTWDRGHFIANSIGGTVDGTEVNVFQQRRDINQGRSEEGRRFRQMERYCASIPGIYLFSRPIYGDTTALPIALEYGVLKPGGVWWVELFPNRYQKRAE